MGVYGKQAVQGTFWGMTQNVFLYGIRFVTSVVIARIIGPESYGLIAMLTIFISVSESFVDSGLGSALIRKKDCTQTDFSSVFYFNLAICIIFYLILWFAAEPISRFFNEGQLVSILRIYGIVLIINGTCIIQNTIITKQLKFRLLAIISIVASIVSGALGIIAANLGYGVWSLVVQTLSQSLLISVLLWIFNGWRPIQTFSFAAFKELFRFGMGILGASMIGKIAREINKVLIGKFMGPTDLGYYTKADAFANLPSSNINLVVSKVSYPILAKIQDDPDLLKAAYQKVLIVISFFSFSICMMMAAVARPMILVVLGEKWRQAASYLPILCFVGALYPLQAINVNILAVKGKSNIIFNITVLKTCLRIIVLSVTLPYGIQPMLWGLVVLAFVEYYINSFYSGKYVDYGMGKQVLDILPTMVLTLLISVTVYWVGNHIPLSNIVILIIQIVLFTILLVAISQIFNIFGYVYVKNHIIELFDPQSNYHHENSHTPK